MQEPKTSILLADELALIREGLALVCESGGSHRVEFQCGDGITALELILEHRPDVAILDLNIPRLFSVEIVRKVQEHQLATRCVILSARPDRKLVMEALRAGVSGFLLKSSSGQQLREALSQLLTGGIYVSPELEIEKIFGRRAGPLDPLETLSTREYQVFTFMIDGIRAKEIAARLDLSPKTIDTYRASLMRKLDIHDVAGLVKFAIQRELTSVA